MVEAINDITAEQFSSNENFQHIAGMLHKLWHENQQYKKMLFGQKRETFVPEHPEQLTFDGIDDNNECEIVETKVQAHSKYKKVKQQPKRTPIPTNLPRKELRIVPDEVKGNEDQYEKIGEEVSEQLEMKPASFWVKRTVREKYKNKEKENIVCAPLPVNIFNRFIANASVIAYVLTAKYADHLPLYRINKIFKRSRIMIAESTMVGWIAYASIYLELLYNRMLEMMENAKIVQADESRLPVVEHNNPKTHQGYMFVYIVDKKFAIFDYRKGRGREGPLEFLKKFRGILQTDGYDGYNAAVKKYELKHVACMAHIRRKFYEAHQAGETENETALALIKELYEIEKNMKEQTGCDIAAMREKQSRPILKKLYAWAIKKKAKVLPQGPTGKAITYFLNEYEKMEKYIRHPQADIDNNLCERTIRPLTIGRKNYLFAGSENGAKRSAIIYSLVLTCRMHGLDPYAYFMKVFEKMAGPDVELDSLLPDRIEL